MPVLLHLGICSTFGGLGGECLQPSLDISGKLCVSPSCISSSSSFQISDRTCQRSNQTFDSGVTMLDGGPWYSTVLNLFADIPQQCPIIKYMFMNVLVGHVLKGLPYLHLNIWLLRNVCCVDRDSLPQSFKWWWGQLKYLHQRSTSSVGRNRQVGVLERVYHTILCLPLN